MPNTVYMICLVIGSVCGVLAYKVWVRHKLLCPGLRINGTEIEEGPTLPCFITVTVIPTLLNAISMLLLGFLYQTVVAKLTNWENHRTDSAYNSSLIIKLFAFHFANSYTSLFYLAFFRPKEHGFQDNGLFGMGDGYYDTCERGTCMPLLSFQVLILMSIKPVPKFCKDIILPWLMKKVMYLYKKFFKKKKKKVEPDAQKDATDQQENDDYYLYDKNMLYYDSNSVDENGVKKLNYIEREYQKHKLGDFTQAEYTEKVLTFGYLVMFSAAIPLAPLIVLCFNLLDNMIDCKRLLWFNRRPVAFIASDMGMWYYIIRFLVLCGVVSNAFIIGYTSSFVEDAFDSQATSKRLLVVIVFEHSVAILMFLIQALTPEKTASVQLAERKEKYQVNKILERGELLEEIGGKRLSNRDKMKSRTQLIIEAKAEKKASGISIKALTDENPLNKRYTETGTFSEFGLTKRDVMPKVE